jgi:hypothetical protein
MIMGEALARKFAATGDKKYFVKPQDAMLAVDALGFRRGAGALKNLLQDNKLADHPAFAQAQGRGIRALSGHIESTDVTNDVNGGPSGVRDYDGDKAVVGRLSYDAAKWLHLSVSGMRTGDLKYDGDYWSELYFGNGWFLPINAATTTRYHANLVEGDIQIRLPHGHVYAFGGYARYEDNDSTANNRRDIYFYSIEGVHDITHKLYAAVRFSQIFADKGYMISGLGSSDEYIFGGVLTKEIWRLSLGLGYRWSPNLITKVEYAFERGKETNGDTRDHEDLFALQAAFKF